MKTVQNREEFLIELNTYLPSNSKGVEIGVLYGDFSQEILKIIKPKELVLIDPYKTSTKLYGKELSYSPTAYSTENDYQDLIRRFQDQIISGQVKVIRDFSYNAVKDFEDKSFDFIYLDGSHVYEDVKQDLKDWLPKLKEGGIMSGHDFSEHIDFGVIMAVREFINECKFYFIIINENGGDWAIRKT